MNPKTLYKLTSKGQLYTWKCWAEKTTVYTEHGLEDGKKTVSSYVALPKNKGRANATTASEQALLEVQAAYRDAETNSKYHKTKKAASVLKPLPMLARQYKDYEDKLPENVYVQPKLDGIRCMYLSASQELILRNGRSANLPHVLAALNKQCINLENVIIDGEIYLHGKTMQEIMSLYNHQDESLEFHIFDIIKCNYEDHDFRTRINLMNSFTNIHSPIKLVETFLCRIKDVEATLADFIEEGYEGIMIRNPEGVYKYGKRSSDLLKFKLFEDDEFEITGFYFGKGKNADVATWTCRTKTGKTFNVLQTGTLESKRDVNHERFVGKMLTVKYQNLTDDGIPRFPVGVGFRVDK